MASESIRLRPVEEVVSALHFEVYEYSGVDHGHLETANSLATNCRDILWRTLVVTLEKFINFLSKKEKEKRGREKRNKGDT